MLETVLPLEKINYIAKQLPSNKVKNPIDF